MATATETQSTAMISFNVTVKVVSVIFSVLATAMMICPPVTCALLAYAGASYVPTENMYGNVLVTWEFAGPALCATSAFVLVGLLMTAMSSSVTKEN
jgi:hypothetical protein